MDEDSRVSALSEPFAIDTAAAATELSDEDDDEELLGDDLHATASSGSVPESSLWYIDFIISMFDDMKIQQCMLGFFVAFLS